MQALRELPVAFGLMATSDGTVSGYEKCVAEIGHRHLRIRMEIGH